MTMPFGKYAGQDIADLPTDYLSWLLSIDLRPRLARAVEDEWNYRHNQPEPERRLSAGITLSIAFPDVPLVRELIDVGYHAAAHRHHPDKGGSVATMRRLNALVAELRAQIGAAT
jgi:hypothetical protein